MSESGARGHVMGALVARKTLVQTGFSAVPLISNLLKVKSRVHAFFPVV